MADANENNSLPTDWISIVLPVRNGGEHIKICVRSILGQTVRNYDLIVLDNASTDGTVDWIRGLDDQRIKIYVSDRPLTIEQSWNRIRSVPRNKFMMIIGHDDIMDLHFLEVIKELVQQHPKASLYQTHFNFIDENGLVKRDCKPIPEVQSSAEFFKETLENGGGFVMRSADYDAVGGIPLYPNLFFADFSLWIDLSRISYKATAKETCFSYREHSTNTSAISAVEKYLAGFEKFVDHLQKLKLQDADFQEAINSHAEQIISLYCRSLSHKLLRTDIEKRNYMTVSTLIKKYKAFADKLIDNNKFNPTANPGVWLAKVIDSNILTRKLFLLFKKIYPKPILK